MKKLYTETEYEEYSRLMNKFGDADNKEKCKVYFEIEEFLKSNDINLSIQRQMNLRLMREDD